MNALSPIAPERLAELTGDTGAIRPCLTVAEIVARRDREIDEAKQMFWSQEKGLSGGARDRLRTRCLKAIEAAESRYRRAMADNAFHNDVILSRGLRNGQW